MESLVSPYSSRDEEAAELGALLQSSFLRRLNVKEVKGMAIQCRLESLRYVILLLDGLEVGRTWESLSLSILLDPVSLREDKVGSWRTWVSVGSVSKGASDLVPYSI